MEYEAVIGLETHVQIEFKSVGLARAPLSCRLRRKKIRRKWIVFIGVTFVLFKRRFAPEIIKLTYDDFEQLVKPNATSLTT